MLSATPSELLYCVRNCYGWAFSVCSLLCGYHSGHSQPVYPRVLPALWFGPTGSDRAFDSPHPGASFAPKCDEDPKCNAKCDFSCEDNPCRCSGEWGPYNLEIVDRVQIPATLAPGEYVLGWRWDCEESNQVWASCSDVTIAAPGV